MFSWGNCLRVCSARTLRECRAVSTWERGCLYSLWVMIQVSCHRPCWIHGISFSTSVGRPLSIPTPCSSVAYRSDSLGKKKYFTSKLLSLDAFSVYDLGHNAGNSHLSCTLLQCCYLPVYYKYLDLPNYSFVQKII